MAANPVSWDRDAETDEFIDPRANEIFNNICITSDTDSYVSDTNHEVERRKPISKKVFVTKTSFESYQPTCTISLTIKRIVELGNTVDATIECLETSIIRCTTSVESVEVPFSMLRDIWNESDTKTETIFGFKLKQKPSDIITITIFLCKYCFYEYGESDVLTDISKATIISDLTNTKEQTVELKGKKTYRITFSIEEINDIRVGESVPKSVEQDLNIDKQEEKSQSDEPSNRQRRAMPIVAKGILSFSKGVGTGIAVEVVKDLVLQLFTRKSENLQKLRKAGERSKTPFKYGCSVFDIKTDIGKLGNYMEIVIQSNNIECRYSLEKALNHLRLTGNFPSTVFIGKITDHIFFGVRKCVKCTTPYEYIAQVKVPLIQYLTIEEDSKLKEIFHPRKYDGPFKLGRIVYPNFTKHLVLLEGVVPIYIYFRLHVLTIDAKDTLSFQAND